MADVEEMTYHLPPALSEDSSEVLNSNSWISQISTIKYVNDSSSSTLLIENETFLSQDTNMKVDEVLDALQSLRMDDITEYERSFCQVEREVASLGLDEKSSWNGGFFQEGDVSKWRCSTQLRTRKRVSLLSQSCTHTLLRVPSVTFTDSDSDDDETLDELSMTLVGSEYNQIKVVDKIYCLPLSNNDNFSQSKEENVLDIPLNANENCFNDNGNAKKVSMDIFSEVSEVHNSSGIYLLESDYLQGEPDIPKKKAKLQEEENVTDDILCSTECIDENPINGSITISETSNDKLKLKQETPKQPVIKSICKLHSVTPNCQILVETERNVIEELCENSSFIEENHVISEIIVVNNNISNANKDIYNEKGESEGINVNSEQYNDPIRNNSCTTNSFFTKQFTKFKITDYSVSSLENLHTIEDNGIRSMVQPRRESVTNSVKEFETSKTVSIHSECIDEDSGRNTNEETLQKGESKNTTSASNSPHCSYDINTHSSRDKNDIHDQHTNAGCREQNPNLTCDSEKNNFTHTNSSCFMNIFIQNELRSFFRDANNNKSCSMKKMNIYTKMMALCGKFYIGANINNNPEFDLNAPVRKWDKCPSKNPNFRDKTNKFTSISISRSTCGSVLNSERRKDNGKEETTNGTSRGSYISRKLDSNGQHSICIFLYKFKSIRKRRINPKQVASTGLRRSERLRKRREDILGLNANVFQQEPLFNHIFRSLNTKIKKCSSSVFNEKQNKLLVSVMSEISDGKQYFIKPSWLSPALGTFITSKMKKEGRIGTDMYNIVIDILSFIVQSVNNNQVDKDAAVLTLQAALHRAGICKTSLEFYFFIMKFTPFCFQRKVLPINGIFSCNGPVLDNIFQINSSKCTKEKNQKSKK